MTSDRPCIVCGRDLDDADRQTCVQCLGAVRRTLGEIEQLYALLPDEIEGRAGAASPWDVTGIHADDGLPLPGGDALVMLGPGAVSRTYTRQLVHAADASHADDEWESDPQSVLADLGGYEDDWFEVRRERGLKAEPEPARPATMMATITYLVRRLTWAAQEWDAFNEFAKVVFEHKARLERTVHAGNAVERGAPCPYCGARIIRRYQDADRCEPVWVPPVAGLGYPPYLGYGPYADRPGYWKWCDHTTHRERHDQGGRREDWVCSNRDCGQLFDDDQHRFAIWQAHELGREAG